MLSSPVLVTAPQSAVIALDRAKSFLRIDEAAQDAEIELMAAAAAEQVENITGQRLLAQRVSLTADRFDDLVALPIGPVRAVVSLSADGIALDAATYRLFGPPPQSGIVAVDRWPRDPMKPRQIELVLDVGYADASAVPPALQMACLAALRGLYEDMAVDLAPLVDAHRIWL